MGVEINTFSQIIYASYTYDVRSLVLVVILIVDGWLNAMRIYLKYVMVSMFKTFVATHCHIINDYSLRISYSTFSITNINCRARRVSSITQASEDG